MIPSPMNPIVSAMLAPPSGLQSVVLSPSERRARVALGLVLEAYPALVPGVVDVLEHERVVDLPGARLMAPRVVGYLHVLDPLEQFVEALAEVPLHLLRVVEVELEAHVVRV